MTTALVTKSGDTLPDLAVSNGDLFTLKYLVNECSVPMKGEYNSIYATTIRALR